MPEAVLRIKAEGGAEVARIAADVERILAGARRTTEAGNRTSRRRQAQDTAASAQAEAGSYRTSGQAIVREDQLVTRARLRELALRGDAQKRFSAAYAEAERDATKILEGEIGKRGELTQREKRQVESLALALVASRERAENRATEITQRGERERSRLRERARREVMSSASTVLSTAGGVAGDVHAQIQGARQTEATRETALNTTLLQLTPGGATAEEIAGLRARIGQQITDARLNPDAVIQALGGAQSFANALGGDTAAERRANVDATMEDVRFASNIDPESIGGLTRVGALTRKNMNAADHRMLMRSFAGIGFAGSVETDQMITRGLPGLQEAWSRGTSGITDPAEVSRRRLEIARDFAAQVQSQAASGRSVTVSANRSNTVRTALGNDYRQDQLGQAYAARRATMTPEQQAAFDANFTRTRDGKYTASRLAAGSASDIARFFGTMHGNDAGAMRNFLGAHGGGGARQLMNTPDVSAIASYFAMATNSRGQQVRQYDYTSELARSAITPEQERVIASVREAEGSRKLNSEEASRLKALTNNTSEINKLSNSFASFVARNPMLAAAAPLAIPGAKLAGGLLATAGGAVAATLGAMTLNARTAITGRDIEGNRVSTLRRVEAAVGTVFLPAMFHAAAQQISNAVVHGIQGANITATVSQHDAAQTAAVNQARGGAQQ